MPEIRYYMVTETRQVRVRANSAAEATMTGLAEMHGKEKPEKMFGQTVGPVRVTAIWVDESD